MLALGCCASPAISAERVQYCQPAVEHHARAGLRVAVAVQHLEFGRIVKGRADREATKVRLRAASVKAGRQLFKDYVAFPALTSCSPGATYKSTATANVLANVIRNVWSNAVIFCGHFPDGAEKFTKRDLEGETKGQWYLRQMLGSSNIDAGPVMAFMTGNRRIRSSIIYPDLPSNRLAEIRCGCARCATNTTCLTPRVRCWCSTPRRGHHRQAVVAEQVPFDSADDAPETRSEKMFAELEPGFAGTDPANGRRRGLKTAIATVRQWRRDHKAGQGRTLAAH